MSTFANLSRRRSDRPAVVRLLVIAGSAVWICGTAAASAPALDAPPDLASIPVVGSAVAPMLRADDPVEIERQQRLRELRRQLLEHSRSWRGDAALRRSAAMPEPTDTPAVVADKILPLGPVPGAGNAISPDAAAVKILPLAPGGAAMLPPVLPDPAPQVLGAPGDPTLPAAISQDAASVQASATPLKTTGAADALAGPDARLTERERRQLRQQLRQVLRVQEPLRNQ